jgi:sulfide:quinone oxidoreductase
MPKSVVIVGGGVGGLFTANKLTSKLASEVRRGEVSITLVEPQEKQVYQPGFLYVPFSELPPDVMFRPVNKLISPLVRVEREPAAKIDLPNRKVVLQSGKELKYDYLVVGTGAVVKTEALPGFGQAWHTLRAYEGARRLREALSRFNVGTVVVSVTSTPYERPVAPYEFLGLLNDYLMATGHRDKTKLVYDAESRVILGVHLVGNGVSESADEAAALVEFYATVDDLALVVHPHPTLSELFVELAEAALGRPTHVARL